MKKKQEIVGMIKSTLFTAHTEKTTHSHIHQRKIEKSLLTTKQTLLEQSMYHFRVFSACAFKI